MLLETLREFALAQLTAQGSANAVRQRHTDYFCLFAEVTYEQLLGADQIQWGTRVGAEIGNLRAAIRWATAQWQIETALRIATGIFRYCWQRGLMGEALGWFEPLFAQRHLVAPDIQSRAFRAAGILAWGLSDYARAQQFIECAIQAAQLAEDDYAVAAATTNLGLIFKEQGDWARAGQCLREAITQNLALHDRPHAVKFPQVILAGLWLRMGQFDDASQLYEESLYHNRQLGDLEGTANSLYGLSLVANARGEYDQAHRLAYESLKIYTDLNHQYGIGWASGCLGNISRDSGDFSSASCHYAHSLHIWYERQDMASVASVLEDCAQLLARQKQWLDCVARLAAADQFRRQAGVKLTPYEAGQHHQLLDACRAILGHEAFEAAWNEGARLTVEQATHFES